MEQVFVFSLFFRVILCAKSTFCSNNSNFRGELEVQNSSGNSLSPYAVVKQLIFPILRMQLDIVAIN